MATVLAEKKWKSEGMRFDAESDGLILNVTSFVHNKYLNTWVVPPMKKEIRPSDSTPAATAERIACEFEVCRKSLPTALNSLRKEQQLLLSSKKPEEAKFFEDVIQELETVQKKGMPVWLAHQEYLTKNELWSHPSRVAERLTHYCDCADARNKTKTTLKDTISSLKGELRNKEGKLTFKEAEFLADIMGHMEEIERRGPRKPPELPPFPSMKYPEVKVPKGKLWTEPVSDRLEKIPEGERNFWIIGDNSIIANPVEFSKKKFVSFTHTIIKETEKNPEGKYVEIERPWIGRDFMPVWTAKKIAEQFTGEKLLKVAELLEAEAKKTWDKKEKAYLSEVAQELRHRHKIHQGVV